MSRCPNGGLATVESSNLVGARIGQSVESRVRGSTADPGNRFLLCAGQVLSNFAKPIRDDCLQTLEVTDCLREKIHMLGR